MSSSEQERLHKEKWKMWSEQRQREQIKKKMNVEQGIQSYAAHLIQKISTQKNNQKEMRRMNKEINNQIESNVCSICLQLMIPPDHQPMILFPCGHNICKDCLFEHPPKGQIRKAMPLNLDKCTLCRKPIQSYALNQNLMTLICTYSNNKDLLEKERQRLEQEQDDENKPDSDIDELRIRCSILEKQQKYLYSQSQKFRTEKTVLSQVIDTLKKEKKKNERQMQKLEEEAKLITTCLSQKLSDFELVEKRLKEITDKKRVVEKALGPLRKEKEKQQLLEVARIISKK